MANWYRQSRTNYVRVKDLEGLKESVAPFGLEVSTKDDDESRVCLLPDDSRDDCGWRSLSDDDVEFDPTVHVMPFLEDGEILVIQEIGHEKLRRLTGWATAWSKDGFLAQVSINDIYGLAAAAACVDEDTITEATY